MCFKNGVDPNGYFRNEPLINELISEYKRGPGFNNCIRIFIEHGLKFKDKALLAVLHDNAHMLKKELQQNPRLVSAKYSLRTAYTPLLNATLMHICAEFDQINCAKLLLEYGAEIDSRAGTDEYGFGVQTPLFHTVNQNGHHSKKMFEFLLENNANLTVTIRGIIWGKGYNWETFIPMVNPISYAQMGLLPQMHRNKKTISEIVRIMMQKHFGINYPLINIPNKYLQ